MLKFFSRYLGSVVLLLTVVVLLSIGTPGSAQAYDAHDSIIILDNTSLVGFGFPGEGTMEDPFLIQDYEIDGAGGSAIAIYDTDLHVKIRNCYLSDSSSPSAVIHLENVKNVTVENNILVDCYVGVVLVTSNNNVLRNNTFENHNTGIVLDNSDYNLLLNNTCVLDIEWPTGRIGIQLISSDHNRLEENNCSGNNDGIDLSVSNLNTMMANICDNNDGNGISIESSIDNTVMSNLCRYNSVGGIMLYSSISDNTGNKICSNTCSGSGLTMSWGAGILLSSSETHPISNNNISDNELSNNYHGIWALNSGPNNITYNDVQGNQVSGIYLMSTSNCNVSSNTIHENGDSGIWLDGSSCCTVKFNTAWDNFNGTYLYDSDNNVLSHNELQGNTYGLYLDSSSYNTINDNNCSDSFGGDGIQLRSSDFNTLLNNTCNGNSDGISTCSTISVFSTHNVIHNNTCNGNTNDGVRVENYGSYTTITNNTCNDNANRGVEVSSSIYCTIANNTCDGNTIGIWLNTESDNNVIDNNNCSGNSQAGIYLSFSYNCVVSNNNCSFNTAGDDLHYGIWLTDSHENTITNNTLNGNGYGIRAYGAFDLVIADNEIHENFCGMYLHDADGSELIGNNCTAASLEYYVTYGIFLTWCPSIIVMDNDCNYNSVGIMTENSDDLTISDNNCDLNYQSGIEMRYAQGNVVSNNSCTGNSIGITVIASDGGTISDNNCSGNVQDGICFYNGESPNNVICNNTLSNNGYGMRLDSLIDSRICNNTCEDNAKAGMRIAYRSKYNVIENNTIINNGHLLENDGYGMWSAGIGMAIDGSDEYNWCDGNIIANNTIGSSRLYGLQILNSFSNRVFGNVFIGNNGASSEYDPARVQAFDDGANFWNATVYGNLWGDWSSPDSNGDGIVDEAYVIDGGSAKDYLPLAISIVILSPGDVLVAGDVNAEISGTAVSYFGVDQVTWYNAATGGSGTCTGTEDWSAEIALMEGENMVTVTMTDLSGNQANVTIALVLDSTPPTLEITSPAEGAVTGGSVTVIWVGSDDGSGVSHYNISVDGGTWTTVTSPYTFNGLVQGGHTIVVRAFDLVGNNASASVNITVDATPPNAEILSPTDGYVNTTGSITITWTGNDTDSGLSHFLISWDGGTPIELPASTFAYTVTGLSDGVHLLKVTVVDLVGLSTFDQVSVTVDTEGPVVIINSPGEGSYVNSSTGIADWTATDAISSLNSTLVRLDGGAWTEIGAATGWIYSLSDGEHTFEVSVTDLAGNSGSALVNFTVDTLAPTAVISPSGNWVAVGAPVVVQFSEQMNVSSVELTIQGVTGSVTWNGTSATFDHLGPFMNGRQYTVNVAGTDLAGNTLTLSWNFTTVRIAYLVGAVQDADGDNLAGVRVTISNGTFSESQLTATNGRFSFGLTGNVTGLFTVVLEKDGYLDTVLHNITYNGEATQDLGAIAMTVEDDVNDGSGIDIYLVLIVAFAAIAVAGIFFLKKRE